MAELRAIVCSHVFDDVLPVLLVAREDGEWLFLCGGMHDDDHRFHVIGVNHLLERDPSLRSLPSLAEQHEAERATPNAPWTIAPLRDESDGP